MSKKRRRVSRYENVPHQNRIRVRGRRRTELDGDRLTLAYWLLAKAIVEGKADRGDLTEENVRKIAERLDNEEAS